MDVSKNYKYFSLIRPQVATSTVTGTGIDTLGYGDDAIAVLDLGAALTTTETCIVTIETSADNSTGWTARTTFSTLLGTSDNKAAAYKVVLDGASKRYVRAVATIVGTTPSFAIAVGLLLEAQLGKSDLNSLTAA